MEKYFIGLTQVNEIKQRYKELAKQNHPDIGGDLEIMKVINSQFEEVISGVFQREGKSITEIAEELRINSQLFQALNEILMLDGVIVEILGNWIWLSGDTRTHKEKIKSAGFMWSGTKKLWYWRDNVYKSYNRKAWSYDQIKASYGSRSFKKNDSLAIA